MPTPRTMEEALQHDLDMPGALNAKRIYYRGYRSCDWHVQDRMFDRALVVIIAVSCWLAWWLS